jgi:hypothetical protein
MKIVTRPCPVELKTYSQETTCLSMLLHVQYINTVKINKNLHIHLLDPVSLILLLKKHYQQ